MSILMNTLEGLIALFEKGLISETQFCNGCIQIDTDGVESIDIEYDADNDRTWVNVVYY